MSTSRSGIGQFGKSLLDQILALTEDCRLLWSNIGCGRLVSRFDVSSLIPAADDRADMCGYLALRQGSNETHQPRGFAQLPSSNRSDNEKK
jgi:hypothetical protein